MHSAIDYLADHTIVTGSDRLARHLQERHARAQLAAGNKVWERPDILPVGAFWRRLAQQLQQDETVPLARRRLLSRDAMACAWEQLVAETFTDQPLLQVPGAARTALDAWVLARDWLLDLDALAGDPLDETRLLVTWGRRFEADCTEHGWLPEYALADAVLGVLEQHSRQRELLPETIQLAGFLELPPAEQQQWVALRALGVEVTEMPVAVADNATARMTCADASAEAAAAAAWIRARIEENPAGSFAVVVPDLAQRRASIRRALLEALAPDALPALNERPMPFNFSLGEPLAAQPLVHDALLLIQASSGRIEFVAAARLCRSPYLAPVEESAARLSMEAALRRGDFAEFSLRDWQFLARRSGCPQFAAALERHQQDVREQVRDALPSEWARRFNRWLENLGWCHGRPLSSEEFQAREAWHDMLGKLADLDPVLDRIPRNVAVTWLRRRANETLFQPRAGAAPVHVMGLLEATGMHFDAMWVMGMDDETLPASPRPNPFLPVALQRQKQLPGASAVREQAFAERVFAGLCRGAGEVVFSYAERKQDAECRPSPLLRQMNVLASPPPRIRTVAQLLFDARAEEYLADTHGSPHAGGRVRGGTALLQNQSHCPFRAFAIHRLMADEWATPQLGPDAKVRGLMVHDVLERLWSRWRNRSELVRAFEQDGFEPVLRASVEKVVDDSVHRERHRWTPSLRELEVERLVKILRRWFENWELPRPDFHVTEIEGRRADGTSVQTVVQAGPLELHGKLDRVDRLNDGSELVIDYKTGDAPRKNAFFGERPAAPQLPAYVLARKQAGHSVPVGIAVASLKAGREGLQGVMRASGDDEKAPAGIPGMENVAKSAAVNSWDEAIAHWERTIQALGEAFAAGDARVDPLRGACDYCHLALFCRVSEQIEFAQDNDDE